MRFNAIASFALLAVLAASCAAPRAAPGDLVHYRLTTQSRLSCCKSMSFDVVTLPGTVSSTLSGDGVIVRFAAERLDGDCASGGEAPLVIANNSAEDVLIPTSHELEGARIKLYPWRLHHDSVTHAPMRLARQIQYGDLFERNNEARLRLMRLPAGREVRLTAWVPGAWLCTKPTELYEGYLEAELDPELYAQRSRGLRTSRFEQARELVSPIGLRYDVVHLTLDFIDALPVLSRTTSPGQDTIAVTLGVNEPPAGFFNAAQRVASSNVIEMTIDASSASQ